jgi:hypothetical protein
MIDADDRCLIVEDNFLILIDLEEMVQSVGFKFVDRAIDLPLKTFFWGNHKKKFFSRL